MTTSIMNTDFLKEYDMLPKGSRVLCAVSGGADSMCLLHMLISCAKTMETEILAAHFNHRIRGEESDRDERFVKEWCKSHGVKCVCGTEDVLSFAEENGLGTEEAARKLRYEFLEKTADSLNCDRIATAHNADDNAETVILNLARGSGAKGLCGIPPVRGKIIRPLLCMSRDEIEKYNSEHSVPHVEDSTNARDDYTRNIIRHRVMPVMREINPAFSDAVMRMTNGLRQDEACLEKMAESVINEYSEDNSIPIEALKNIQKPVAVRVFRKICGRALTMTQAESIYALLSGEGTAFSDVSGMRVMRDTGRLYFNAEHITLGEYELRPNESLHIPEIGVSVRMEIIENCTEVFSSVYKFDFNYRNICGSITLTPRKSGDKIKLLNRGCTKSLKDLFLERKIPSHKRDAVPVFRDERGVAGVLGFGVDKRCAAVPGDTVLRVTVYKTDCTGDNYSNDKRYRKSFLHRRGDTGEGSRTR